jgi:pantetheine-phosphate adenylyltransferase
MKNRVHIKNDISSGTTERQNKADRGATKARSEAYMQYAATTRRGKSKGMRNYVAQYRKAIYAGSFDPLTFGHLDIIERGLNLFDELVIGVGNNSTKEYLFTSEERVELCENYLSKLYKGIAIESFDSLLVDFAKKHQCKSIIRGLRVNTDFEFEYQLGLTNMNIDKSVETIFLLARPQNIFVSASMVKEIASFGGDVSNYVPEVIAERLRKKFQRRK